MRKFFLFTITLIAIGAMYFAPVTAQASASFVEPTVEACGSCHVEPETMLSFAVDSGVAGQVAIEVASEGPTWSPGIRTTYGEETAFYRGTHYISSFAKGSSKVPI